MLIKNLVLEVLIGASDPSKLKPTVLNALHTVEILQSDGQSAGFQITFNAERADGAKPDYDLLKEPLLRPGSRVVVTVYLNMKPYVLMDGIITHQQLVFGQQQGPAPLMVIGRDLTVKMDLIEQRKGYAGLKQHAVVEQILGAYAGLGITPKVVAPQIEWPLTPQQHVPFQTGTDLAYLRRLAAANGYVFYLRPGPAPKTSIAYWGPPDRKASAQLAMTLNSGADTNIDSISFAYDVLSSNTISYAQIGQEQPALTDIAESTSKPVLSKDAALTAYSSLERKRWVWYAGPDANEIKARAQAQVDLATGGAASATGKLNVVRYGDVLSAPGIVGVRGVGETYDGNYYVKTVKHRISRGTYTQEFTLTREGAGSSVPQVKV